MYSSRIKIMFFKLMCGFILKFYIKKYMIYFLLKFKKSFRYYIKYIKFFKL